MAIDKALCEKTKPIMELPDLRKFFDNIILREFIRLGCAEKQSQIKPIYSFGVLRTVFCVDELKKQSQFAGF